MILIFLAGWLTMDFLAATVLGHSDVWCGPGLGWYSNIPLKQLIVASPGALQSKVLWDKLPAVSLAFLEQSFLADAGALPVFHWRPAMIIA